MPESYKLEPWLPSISPGAPVPAPEFVPWRGTLKPGTYYSHSAGMFDGRTPDIRNFYKEGLRVKAEPGGAFRPTAQTYRITPEMLKKAKHAELLKRVANWQGTRSGQLTRSHQGAPFVKNPPSTKIGNVNFPPPRAASLKNVQAPQQIIGRLPKGQFNPANPSYAQKPGAVIETSAKGHFGHKPGSHTGNISPKTIEAHFPKGSNTPLTKPGLVTGKMPAIRGLGGGMLGFFNFGPLESAKMKGVIPYADPNRIY